MFIEISPHEGVYKESDEDVYKGSILSVGVYRRDLKPLESYRLNLNLVRKVFFETEDVYEDQGCYSIEIEEEYNYKKITLNKITFKIITSGEDRDEVITLYFTKEGEGEYQRIKRIIDENTFR
jgi:hypothetical protein